MGHEPFSIKLQWESCSDELKCWASNGRLGGKNKPQRFFIFSQSSVSSHLRTFLTHSFSFLATQPKSQFTKLSILIEIINPFYSFPDFHFVRSVVEKKAIESSICTECNDI